MDCEEREGLTQFNKSLRIFNLKNRKMKILTLSVLLTVFLAACSDEDPTVYNVQPDISVYVDSFYAEAQTRGKVLTKDNLIVTVVSECQAITVIEKKGDQWYLKFDKEAFGYMAGHPNNLIEAMLFHELGKIVLNRELTSGNSIMNGDVKVSGYSSTNRSALLDELFK